MLHVLCATLVLMVALTETTILRQWSHQRELAWIQQASIQQAALPSP